MSGSKRVLLLYISERSGHHSASLAIERALKELDAGVDTLNINSFNYTNPILERIVNRTYMGVIQRTPEVWDYLYDNPKVLKRMQGFRELIHHHNSAKLKGLLDEFRPDVIVCTQAFPCGMIADFKKSFDLKVPLIGVITDYVAHSYWIFDNVDFYVVPTDETRDKLTRSGVDSTKIKVCGIPIDPDFAKSRDKAGIANRLGIDLNTPVLLVMGGGQGLGPIKKIIRALFSLGVPLQIITATGVNKRLFESLTRLKVPAHCRLLPFGYVNSINEFMDLSNILITKPGGITVSEALSKGLPMIIVKPLPGQEAKNTEFLLKANLALKADSVDELSDSISKLLTNPSELASMKERQRLFAKPNAAEMIAKLILESLNRAYLLTIQNWPSAGLDSAR